jgi:hypothetical protein
VRTELEELFAPSGKKKKKKKKKKERERTLKKNALSNPALCTSSG